MRLSQILAVAAAHGGGSATTDVDSWAAAVVANGGSVSAGRKTIVGTYIASLKTGGSWALTDDFWLLVAENEGQALTSLKQRRLATATAAPTFTADSGYGFNGSTQYLTTGFIPSTHAVAMTGSNMRMAVYERTNVGVSGTYDAGTTDSTTQALKIGARSAGNVAVLALDSSATNIASGITDSRGLTAASRTAAGVFEAYKNGVSIGTVTPASTGTALPTRVILIGAQNNVGTPLNFRAATIGFVSVGASLTAGQELSAYNALQSLMTAIGANV